MLFASPLISALLAGTAGVESAAWGAAACEMMQGTAASQAAPLLAPTLFASTGFVNAGEAPTSDLPPGGPTYRVTVGASYSLGRLVQGLAVRSRAEVACSRERARLGLEAALSVGDVLGAERALAARAVVLQAALPVGEQMVKRVGVAVQEVRATVDVLDADHLRLEELRALASETSLALARASSAHPQIWEVPGLLALYRAADHQLGLAEEGARGAGSWDLALRGGYDRLSDGRDRVPFFAILSASFDLGRLWRGPADSRALAGRARAEEESADALAARVSRLLESKRAILAAEGARLRASQTLLASLDGQMAQVERLETARVDRFRNTLWFEIVRMRAERAYLAAHVEDLARAFGEEDR
jgi:hypothetical protein